MVGPEGIGHPRLCSALFDSLRMTPSATPSLFVAPNSRNKFRPLESDGPLFSTPAIIQKETAPSAQGRMRHFLYGGSGGDRTRNICHKNLMNLAE